MSKKQSKPSGASRAEAASDEYLGELFGLETEIEPDAPQIEVVTTSKPPQPDANGDFEPYVIWADASICDDNPYQPRNIIFKQPLDKLITSINENGQIQPATGRPHPTKKGRIQLGVGHRRNNAVKHGANAGIKMRDPHLYIGKIRVEISNKSDEQMLNEAYAENEDREPLSVFDRASYYTMLRELESRRLRGGLTPVSSETARKRAGAAVTSDGLMSWEELVEIRKREGKPLPGARTLRRIVGVLDIPDSLRDRLAAINLANPDDEEAEFKGITEKHCSAVLLLAGSESKQNKLIEEIAENRLSANKAEARAIVLRDGVAPAQPAPDDQPAPGTNKEEKKTPASTSNTNDSTSKNQGKSASKNKKQDLVEAFITPASRGLSEATKLWPKLRVGEDYKKRMLDELDELDAKSAALRKALEGV